MGRAGRRQRRGLDIADMAVTGELYPAPAIRPRLEDGRGLARQRLAFERRVARGVAAQCRGGGDDLPGDAGDEARGDNPPRKRRIGEVRTERVAARIECHARGSSIEKRRHR